MCSVPISYPVHQHIENPPLPSEPHTFTPSNLFLTNLAQVTAPPDPHPSLAQAAIHAPPSAYMSHPSEHGMSRQVVPSKLLQTLPPPTTDSTKGPYFTPGHLSIDPTYQFSITPSLTQPVDTHFYEPQNRSSPYPRPLPLTVDRPRAMTHGPPRMPANHTELQRYQRLRSSPIPVLPPVHDQPEYVPLPIPSRSPPSHTSIPLQHPVPQHAQIYGSHIPAARPKSPNQHGLFNQASNFVISNSRFNDFSLVGLGLQELLKDSMPDAFHDSLARYPPPKCHLGTREDYIKEITSWALGQSERKESVLWMQGPFGVGKTAVAQSSAEALKLLDKLLATLFFSRSSRDRDDPRRTIPSLVYQITTHCEQFANIIDERLRKDRSLTTKALPTQFDELLVIPLRKLDAATRTSLEGRVIIIDGLDECRGTEDQCEIIRIIATSAQNRTTPFRWFITSRPEGPIIRTMDTHSVSPAVSRIELPVSRLIDHEILLFLTDEFTKIREDHGLPESWPSDKVLALLVERGAGLWIYVSTIVRFVNSENSLGPEDQLKIVLRFISDVSKKVELNNPLADMDFLYTLIMERVPPHMLKMVRRIVLLCSIHVLPKHAAGVLGLSFQHFQRFCVFIESVMDLKGASMADLSWRFYHASFGDYLKDYSSQLEFPDGTTSPEGISRKRHYVSAITIFWLLCAQLDQPIDVPTAGSISKLPFQKMFGLTGLAGQKLPFLSDNQARSLRVNLPVEFRNKIIRRQKCPAPGCRAAKSVWMLSHGDNGVFLGFNERGNLCVQYDQDGIPLPTGNCQCGAQFQDSDDDDDDDDDEFLG
ncbi:hypothetical protein NP233_g10119 [Leucocoprinus birnbaumii]|uniref:Nephrocystin 3-like N-terminal domain-containing protein n=1 Tax=Leucocoprinus birnbaumii TaxID=56174 RepID=A0AAD5YS70_9AGAR|nr:hypothetical protein NP233_g10119 [Leucocoprinus birnbaumii]